MKWCEHWLAPEQWRKWWKKNKLVLVLILAGVALLALPTRETGQSKTEATQSAAEEETFSLDQLEERLAQAISRIQGAGQASVVLSLDQGVERVLATDTVEEQGEDSRTQEQTTVVYSGKEGEDVAVLTQYYPSFRGALVVCPGGEDPQVRLAVTQAVSALTGLGSDRITVCAGE